jgi:MFS family permease
VKRTIAFMQSLASHPGALRLFALSIVARMPLVMLSIGLLVHAQRLTGSFAAAGAVSGAYAVALGVGGPLLGRLVDRRGQTAPLLGGAAVTAALLLAVAVLPVGVALAPLAALAAVIGLASPPLAACLRGLLPGLLPDPVALRTAYAIEATATEVTWVAGPPVALGLGVLWSTGGALAAAAIVLALATAAFAAQPASRDWRPAPAPAGRGGSLASPAMRTLVLVLLAAGVLFGACEVAVTAAADALGSTGAAAPLMALWGAGSLAGGLVAVRLGGGAHNATGLGLVLCALAGGHLALVPAAGSAFALGAVLLVAGAAIAPTFAAVYAMVEDAAPAGTATEAFAWLATAIAVGGALGAALAGALCEQAGPQAAFALAGGAGALAVLVTLLRSGTIGRRDGVAAVAPALA